MTKPSASVVSPVISGNVRLKDAVMAAPLLRPACGQTVFMEVGPAASSEVTAAGVAAEVVMAQMPVCGE